MQRLRLAALICLFLGGCAATATAPCGVGMHSSLSAELFFGRDMQNYGEVSEADWSRFVDEEVTTRFPDGLTVLDGAGQWREPGGSTLSESSKVVIIVLPGRPDDRARLEAIREAYKGRFRQRGVLLVMRSACAGF